MEKTKTYEQAMDKSLAAWKKDLDESYVYTEILKQLEEADKGRLNTILSITFARAFSSGITFEADVMYNDIKKIIK